MSKDHMLREIREQPGVLGKTRELALAFLKEHPVDWGAYRRIHLLGCGDMDFAARTASWLARKREPCVTAHRSMDLRWQADRMEGEDLVIAASFSGRTPRTVEAAMLAKDCGAAVWGITGNQESPLTAAVDRVLLLETGPRDELTRHDYAGYHHNVPQTKTFTAALLAELVLLEAGGCLGEKAAAELAGLEHLITQVLPSIEAANRLFMDGHFIPVKRIAVLGSGPWRAIAAFGAAKFLEMAIPARVQCIEENNHLEMFVTDAEEGLIFLAPDLLSWQRAREMLGPYGRFDAPRMVLAPASVTGCGEACSNDPTGAVIVALPESGMTAGVFIAAIALQVLAAATGRALGRDIDQWVGGLRVGLVEELGQALVRESEIKTDCDGGSGI